MSGGSGAAPPAASSSGLQDRYPLSNLLRPSVSSTATYKCIVIDRKAEVNVLFLNHKERRTRRGAQETNACERSGARTGRQ